MKLFKVEAKCGHVGKNNFTIKIFAIRAENGKEAAMIARNKPRVKHHHKDAIRSVVEITEIEYLQIIKQNNDDPYFKCRNIQEQRIYVQDCDVYVENKEAHISKSYSKKAIYYKKKRVRNPQKFFKNYKYETRCNLCQW